MVRGSETIQAGRRSKEWRAGRQLAWESIHSFEMGGTLACKMQSVRAL